MAEGVTHIIPSTTAPLLPDGCHRQRKPESGRATAPGTAAYVPLQLGPTHQLATMCTGMAVLDPGASPHPPHQHPEEEFMIVASGVGVIEVDGKSTPVGPGAMHHVLRRECISRHYQHRYHSYDFLLVQVDRQGL